MKGYPLLDIRYCHLGVCSLWWHQYHGACKNDPINGHMNDAQILEILIMNNNTETKLPRLYKAYTHTDRFSLCYDDLQIDLVCKERSIPVADYDELIAGYDHLRPKAKAHAERCVNEFFIEEEIKKLTTLLMEKGEVLYAREVVLPVCCEEMTIYERSGEWRLYADKGYNLSIPVVGWYDDDILTKLRLEREED